MGAPRKITRAVVLRLQQWAEDSEAAARTDDPLRSEVMTMRATNQRNLAAALESYLPPE